MRLPGFFTLFLALHYLALLTSLPVHGMLREGGCEDFVCGLHHNSTAVAVVDGIS